jgi:hypothetical protein
VHPRAGSENAATDLDRLLWTLGIRPPRHVLHVQLEEGSANSLTAQQLWWTARSSDTIGRRLVSIDRRSTPATHLPFLTGQFDFAVCAGVVERLGEPARFLAELRRVAQGGYIECRRAMAQIFQPDPTIRWLIDYECDTLFFREYDPTDTDTMEPLRRRMDAHVPIAHSMKQACASARLRPLIFVELVWSGRFKYRILRDGARSRANARG